MEKGVPLPSPEALKRKIIIKNKKTHSKTMNSNPMPISRGDDPGISEIPAVSPQIPSSTATKEISGVPQTATASASASTAVDGDSGDSDSEDEEGIVIMSSNNSNSQSAASTVTGGGTSEEGKTQESRAAEEISMLVNYVQAVKFHGFDRAESKSSTSVHVRVLRCANFFPPSFFQGKTDLTRCLPSTRRLQFQCLRRTQ